MENHTFTVINLTLFSVVIGLVLLNAIEGKL